MEDWKWRIENGGLVLHKTNPSFSILHFQSFIFNPSFSILHFINQIWKGIGKSLRVLYVLWLIGMNLIGLQFSFWYLNLNLSLVWIFRIWLGEGIPDSIYSADSRLFACNLSFVGYWRFACCTFLLQLELTFCIDGIEWHKSPSFTQAIRKQLTWCKAITYWILSINHKMYSKTRKGLQKRLHLHVFSMIPLVKWKRLTCETSPPLRAKKRIFIA